MNIQLGGAAITGAAVMAMVWILLLRNAEPKQRRRGIEALALGLVAGFPVGGIMLLLALVMPETLGPLQASLYRGLVSSAVPAELGKLVIVAVCINRVGRGRSRHPVFGPIDGARLGSAVALGLAAIESAFYLAVEGGWATAVLRACPGILVQTTAGAMIGYALAARRAGAPNGRRIWPVWVQAVLLHGGYGFAVLGMVEVSYLQLHSGSDLTPLIVTLFALLVAVTLIAVYRLMRVFRLAHAD